MPILIHGYIYMMRIATLRQMMTMVALVIYLLLNTQILVLVRFIISKSKDMALAAALLR